jgi:hypothetical protein
MAAASAGEEQEALRRRHRRGDDQHRRCGTYQRIRAAGIAPPACSPAAKPEEPAKKQHRPACPPAANSSSLAAAGVARARPAPVSAAEDTGHAEINLWWW